MVQRQSTTAPNQTIQLNDSQVLQAAQTLPQLEVDMNDSQLIASVDDASGVSNQDVIMALGGGTGATIGGTGILELDQDLVRRMRYQDSDIVPIYKNTAWANFMHSRTTKVLCALSILGWVVYLPYMWLRCTSTMIRTRYTIDIPISGYWPLIADKLTADGFVDDPDARATDPRTMQFIAYGGGQIPRGDREVPAGLADIRSADWDVDWHSATTGSDT